MFPPIPVFFFFSSRRRHTRWTGDWSSDVCSSDLEHTLDLPPARHMLVVHNEDRPGMIGQVTTVLGEAGVNISDMGVGRSPTNEAALMVMATDALVPADVLARVLAGPGVQSARAIDLG